MKTGIALMYFQMLFVIAPAQEFWDCRDSVEHWNRLGIEKRLSHQYEESIQYLHLAVRRIRLCISDSSILVPDTYFSLAKTYDLEEKLPDSAIYYYRISLNWYEKILSPADEKIADATKGIADVYRYVLHDYVQAEIFYLKTLKIFDEINLDPSKRAVCLYDLGTTYREMGHLEKALTYLNEAKILVDHNRNSKDIRLQSKIYNAKANVYNNANELDKAIEAYQKAIDLLSTSFSDSSPGLSYFQNNLAVAYYKNKEYDMAITYFRKAMEIEMKSHDERGLSTSLYGLGQSYREKGQFDHSLRCFFECLDKRRINYGEKHPETARIYRQIGLLFHKKRDYDSALFYFQHGLVSLIDDFNEENVRLNPSFSQLPFYMEVFMILSNKGETFYEMYRDNEKKAIYQEMSQDCYNLAKSFLLYYRKTYENENIKLFTIDHFNYIFQGSLGNDFERWNRDKKGEIAYSVLSTMEMTKAQLLFEQFQKIRQFNDLGVPDSLTSLEGTIKKQITHEKKRLKDNHLEFSPELQLLQDKQSGLKVYLRTKYPSFYKHNYYDQLPSLDSVQFYLKKRNCLLLEYYWAEDAIYLLAADGRKAFLHKIEIDEELSNALTSFLAQISQPPLFAGREEQFQSYVHHSRYLYKKLVAPALINLNVDADDIKKLVVIPDGPLSFLPFEALLTEDIQSQESSYSTLPYLLFDYPVQYAYSLKILMDQSIDKPTKYEKGILAMAFGSGGKDASNLPGSLKEINSIRKRFHGQFFIGKDANKSTFLKMSNDFDILHLAVHGEADKNNGSYSKLIFNKGPGARSSEQELYAYELYDRRFSADLVVLSACESGIGKWNKGEGVYSMARAFAYSGVPSQIISLWRISDHSTSQLSDFFYRYLQKSKNPSSALWQAKIDYIKNDEKAAHPYYWAALIFLGKGNNFPEHQNVKIVALILIIGIITLVIFKKRKTFKDMLRSPV